jgi:hypothetical protein
MAEKSDTQKITQICDLGCHACPVGSHSTAERRTGMAEISGVILLVIGLFVSPIVGMWLMAFLV